MKTFGQLTGMAFQIKDDLLDFKDASDTGKPTGIDIKEKKMTLPVIYALQQAGNREKNEMMNLIRNNRGEQATIDRVLAFVKESGGIAHAETVMHDFKNQAQKILMEFEANPARNSLDQLLNFTIARKK
jgi:octaprenyl-diphosphate synthase